MILTRAVSVVVMLEIML